MSKWIKKELFNRFKAEVAEDQEKKNQRKTEGGGKKWAKLEKGTTERPNTYEGRFLPDKDGSPAYKKMFYHMWQRGDEWVHLLCDKTFDFNNFCPYCQAAKQLWGGSEGDKKLAKAINRKEKYVANFYITDDPRDKNVPNDIENRDAKINTGKVKLFEFGVKLESKVRQEILDEKEGLGYAIFDPADGHNFIIKVKATKADAKGNVWPDYADSKFSRSSTSLGSDKEIREVMDNCYDLGDYLNSQKKTPAELKEMLEKDMLWKLVEADWNRVYGIEPKVVHKAVEIEGKPSVDPIEDEDVVAGGEYDPGEIDDLDEALKDL